MFSPDSTINSLHGSVARNPRRRQRKDSDSVRLQPHRKRNKLSGETFVSPSTAKVNGNGSAVMNGHAGHADGETTFVSMDMPVREKKLTGKRAHKDDGSILLVSISASQINLKAGTNSICLPDKERKPQRQEATGLSYSA